MGEEEKILEFIKQEYGNYDNYVRDLLDLYNKVKEENKDLKEDFRCYTRKVINGVFQDEYIKKSKIKNKIEELENYIQENSDGQGYWGTKHQEEIYAKIEILEELLEEEN